MAGSWSLTTLGAIASKTGYGLVDGPFGSNLPASCYTVTGIPVIRGSNLAIGTTRFRADEFVFVSEETAQQHARSLCRPRDIVFTKKGTIGQTGYVPEAGKHQLFLLSSNQMKLTVDVAAADPLFVYYYVSSPLNVEKIIRDSEATGVPKTNVAYFRDFPIPLPPLAEQQAIAAVLGALDDKIELNRRMNATLEAMAQALFQSWFVDFDPVRAKLDGRTPAALDSDTATLFPSSFDETELGHVPHGWTAGNFGTIIAAERERIGESDAVVLSAVASSQLVRSDEHFIKQVYSKSISKYLKVRRWDFAYNPSRINIGSIGMLKESVIGAVSPVYEVFRPKAGYHWFVERSLAQPDTKVWIQTLCSGSVRQSLKLRDLESIPLVVPPPPIVQAFNKTWEQWHALIQANNRESRTLATLRDTLLPKLLSGQLSTGAITAL